MFFESFADLFDACVAFYKANGNAAGHERVRRNRCRLSDYAYAFHQQCGTLTPSVKKRLEDLRSGRCVVLMTAHQPNFFPYSGVFRKATLNFVLERKLEELLGVPVVNLFGVADQDFTDDRWVRCFELPAVRRKRGIFSIDVKLPEKLMLNKVPKPSEELLSHWKSEVENWLSDAINSIGKLSNKLVLDAKLSASTISTLHENLASFWEIPEDCWRRSNTYADFNGFLMSHVVNGAWGYDTVFVRFSECQQVFVDEFRFLLSRFKDYTRLLKEADEITQSEGVHGGVAGQESSLAPFWYHCSCGSKAKLFVEMRDGFLSASGSCVRCGRPYRLDFGHGIEVELEKMASRISARAIPMGLVLFNGLQPSCYVGGVAGQAYLAEAQHVAEGLGIVFPPIVVWRPCDKYVGVGQAEASLELQQASIATGARDLAGTRDLVMSQISKIRGRLDEIEASKKSLIEELKKNPDDEELKEKLRSVSMAYTRACRSSDLSVLYYRMKIIENVMVVSGLMPSIIDYAVNVGLRETRDQWERYLNGEGGLKSDVCLESVLSRDGDLNSALLRV